MFFACKSWATCKIYADIENNLFAITLIGSIYYFHIKNLENLKQKHIVKLIGFTLEKNSKTFPLSLLKNSEILLEKKYYMGFEFFFTNI
jgi:hypothetical protein